ncbi:unnamed protein product, partial [Prorocentrum cordatum]
RRALTAIHDKDVRFVLGLFDIPNAVAAEFFRDCGAPNTQPIAVFHQAGIHFQRVAEHQLVTHQNWVVPLGECEVRVATYQERVAPPLPRWLTRTNTSAISSAWDTVPNMPQWQEDANRNRGIQHQLSWETHSQHHKEGTHQNYIFIGHGRQGQNAAERQRTKPHRKKDDRKKDDWKRDAWKKDVDLRDLRASSAAAQ